ncbi:MAG: hydrogenase maturation protease [Kofleriaceae bacterium]
MTRRPQLLVLGIGNPSRGDDALGPMFVERIGATLAAEIARGDVELLTDFQLQIEHTLDLQDRARVVFVDASVRATSPFEYARIAPGDVASHTTHAMSPEALLGTYRDVLGDPPPSFVLAIRGERFELGEPLSDTARDNLEAAVRHLAHELFPIEAIHA